MNETQEANLPLEKELIEETGKLETSKAPAENPVETALESAVSPDDTSSSEDIISVDGSVTEVSEEIIVTEEIVPEEVEPEVIEPEEAILEAVFKTGEAVLEAVSDPVESALEEPEQEDAASIADVQLDDFLMEDNLAEDALDEVYSEIEEVALTDTDYEADEMAFEDEYPSDEPDETAEEEEESEEADEIETSYEKSTNDPTKKSKDDIFEQLRQLIEAPKKYHRNEVDTLKQTYYRLRRSEIEAKKKEFLESGGDEKDFITPKDETEAQFKALLAEFKEKRATMVVDEERQKETNLIIKQHLIERLKILTESQDDFNKRYREFREIQRKWKEIKLIPQEYSRELWRNYQLYNERFYDIVKINNQFREYDFKKNLEMKTVLCETVERLAAEPDVISAFHQLQKLHQQWREIGPVSKEYRNSIWERFKEASAAVNKRQQNYYDDLKGQEEKNFKRKDAICKELEGIDFSAIKTLKDWEKKTEKVKSLQAKWRSTGFASKRQNSKVSERFRTASNNFFNKKMEFYKTIKKEIDQNYDLKKALVEKAESLKNSDNWKETAKEFVELQNEWKKIGHTGRKYSDVLWKQFIAACDYFFERKSKEAHSHKSEENENLELKLAVIEKIKTIDKRLTDDQAVTLLKGYINEWNTIGFVPFKEKDKLHQSFREAVDKQFERLKVNEHDRRGQQTRAVQADNMSDGSKNKLYNERDRLMRTFDRMKNELQTYENNIGFISAKGGDGLLKELNKKIARIKEEMETIVRKIEAIDENLD